MKNKSASQVSVALIIFDAGYSAYVTYYVDSGEIICEQKISETQSATPEEPYLLTIQQNYFIPAHEEITPELTGDIFSDE